MYNSGDAAEQIVRISLEGTEVALKLTGFIGWSWLWVLSPLWISLTIRLVLALIIAAIDS